MYLVKFDGQWIGTFATLSLARQYVDVLGGFGDNRMIIVKDWQMETV